ncbi:MAG: methionine biosynthesis protein MetW [Spirochaetaceae bacterium]|nr:MAG: methionine biosynthesis protein MetW [Spirochaetaceae bacterium]
MYKELHKQTTFAEIAEMIEPDSHVLDLGCGDGSLLDLLRTTRQVSGIGIDIDEEAVLASMERGLTAVSGDLDQALAHYADRMYDYVILSQTLQVVKRPDHVLEQIVRVGKQAIVSFPNFAYYKVRFGLLFGGHMPKSKILPYEWFDTPNIHLLTINDFKTFCKIRGIEIVKAVYLHGKMKKRRVNAFANILAEEALFVIRKT